MIGVSEQTKLQYLNRAQEAWLGVRAFDRRRLEEIRLNKKNEDKILVEFVERRIATLDSWHLAPLSQIEKQIEIKERKWEETTVSLEKKALDVELTELEECREGREEVEKVEYYVAPKKTGDFINAVRPLNKDEMEQLAICLFTERPETHPIERIPPKIFVNRRVLFLDSKWEMYYVIQGDPNGSFYMESGNLNDENKLAYKSNSLPDLLNNGMDLMTIDGIFIGGIERQIYLKTDAKKAFPLVPVEVEI